MVGNIPKTWLPHDTITNKFTTATRIRKSFYLHEAECNCFIKDLSNEVYIGGMR